MTGYAGGFNLRITFLRAGVLMFSQRQTARGDEAGRASLDCQGYPPRRNPCRLAVADSVHGKI